MPRDAPIEFGLTKLSGAPRERGRAHGAARRALVHAHIEAWLSALGAGGVGEPRAYVARMLQETDFLPAIRAETPDLLEEIEGIAEGAGASFDLVFGLQLLDEEWAHRLRVRSTADRLEKCSSVAIVGSDGPTWIGQNMDLGSYTDGWQTALAIGADGVRPAAMVFSLAGMIGLMGVNAAGVGVCVNSLPQLPSAPRGLPVAFVLRRLLQATSLAEAVRLALSLPHATNQHYVIAEPGGARSFEASSAGVSEYAPPDPSRVLHTNHPLSDAPAAEEEPAARENSTARLGSLTARLSAGPAGFAEIAGALCAFDDPRHPVCRLRGEGPLAAFTTGSMISSLEAAGVTTWISPGPPSETGYDAFRLDSEFDREGLPVGG